jgi:multidrug resistance efflux pump
MTALLEILAKVWPFILMAGGVLFGVFRHQQAKTATAQANQKMAEAEAKVAQANAALAQANQAGAQAGADNAKVRHDEDDTAGALPDANRVLHDEWGKN